MSDSNQKAVPTRIGTLAVSSGKYGLSMKRLLSSASVDQGRVYINNSDIGNIDHMEICRHFGVGDLSAEELDRAQIRAVANINKDYGAMGSEINRGIIIGYHNDVWVDEGWQYHGGRLTSFQDMNDKDWERAHSYIDYFGREDECIIDSLGGYYNEHGNTEHEDVWKLLRQHKDTHYIEYFNKLKGGFKPGELTCISVGRQCGKSMLVKEFFKAEVYAAMDKKRDEVNRVMRRTGISLQLLPFEDKDIMMMLFGKYNNEILEGYGKWKQLSKKLRSR